MRGTGSLKVRLTLIVFTLLCVTTKQAWAKYGGGSGTAEYPYLIYTAEQMNTIGLNYDDYDKHFKLMADIDLSGYTGTAFNIIGVSGNSFRGTFDGNGHKISNFSYYEPGGNDIALFGRFNGTLKNLGLISPDVDAATSTYDWTKGSNIGSLIGQGGGNISGCYVEGGSVSGNSSVGGLAGDFYGGTISDCYSTCSVSSFDNVGGVVGLNGGTITNCNFSGNVSGTRGGIGGLVGQNISTISACHSAGRVTGVPSGYYEGTGGLVGVNGYDGIITYCYSEANVSERYLVGGLVGVNWGQISDCYATGNAHGVMWIGGLVGGNASYIYRCYSTGNASGTSWVGGLVGGSEGGVIIGSFWDRQTSGNTWSVGGTGKTTSQMQTKSIFTSASWDFTTPIWTIEDNDYPRFWWEENILYVPGHYPTIQAAIDAAVDGDIVLVAPGTYTGEGNRDIDFLGKAIAVRSIDPNNPNMVENTIIDCNGSESEPHRGFYFHNGEDADSIVSGLTITNGWSGIGSGIYGNNTLITIKNCVICNNTSKSLKSFGGGIARCNGLIQNCVIKNNEVISGGTVGRGGGIYECQGLISNCTISWNIAREGGGLCNCNGTIENCVISNNEARYNGGGAALCESDFINCLITDNHCRDSSGGGVYGFAGMTKTNLFDCLIENNSAPMGGGVSGIRGKIIRCMIIGNSAFRTTTYSSGKGGGLRDISGEVSNSVIANNQTESSGGALYNSNTNDLIIRNCTLYNNTHSAFYIWQSYIEVNNSIIWNNMSLGLPESQCRYCCIEDWEGGGTGNFSSDPLLEANSYHLLPSSPCIDAGDPNSDFGLEPEPDGGRINMGAYGNTPEATCEGGLVLQSYNRISKTRVGREIFDYEFTITLKNNSDVNVSNVQLELLDASENVTIIDSQVNFAYIAAGQAADSDDTFIIQVDRSVPIDVTKISWRAIYEADGFTLETESLTRIELEDATAGDISGDGKIDFEDLSRLAEMWLWTGQAGEIAEDIFADGIVNFKDFAKIAEGWGN